MRTDDLAFMPTVRKLIGGRGLSFDELVRAVPAVLPEPGVVPVRQVRPQPRGAQHAVDPFGFQLLRRPHDDRDGAAEGRLPDRARRQVPQRLRQAADPGHRKPSLHYVPPGWTSGWPGWTTAFGPRLALRRRHLPLLLDDAERQRQGRRPQGRVLDVPPRAADPRADHRLRQDRQALVHLVDPGGAALRRPVERGRPGAGPRRQGPIAGVQDAGAAQVGQGLLRQA